MASQVSISGSTSDLRSQYRALPLPARIFATTRPHQLYWLAAFEVVVFAALGAWLMTRTVPGGILIALIGIVGAAFPLWAARWSEQHSDQANKAVRIQRELRNRLAQRHPAYFLVFVPILLAVDASLRFNRYRHHPSTLDWTVPAAIALVFGLVIGSVVVHRARRARRSAS